VSIIKCRKLKFTLSTFLEKNRRTNFRNYFHKQHTITVPIKSKKIIDAIEKDNQLLRWLMLINGNKLEFAKLCLLIYFYIWQCRDTVDNDIKLNYRNFLRYIHTFIIIMHTLFICWLSTNDMHFYWNLNLTIT